MLPEARAVRGARLVLGARVAMGDQAPQARRRVVVAQTLAPQGLRVPQAGLGSQEVRVTREPSSTSTNPALSN